MKLEYLNLSKKTSSLGQNKIGDENIHFLENFSLLKELKLANTGITGRAIEILSKKDFPNLSFLDFCNTF